MIVTKPIDVVLLGDELLAAGVVVTALGTSPTEVAGEIALYTFNALGEPIDLPPEAEPVVAAHDASTPGRTKAFAAQEDRERLALVAERSQTDPAFAALADLALGTQGGTP